MTFEISILFFPPLLFCTFFFLFIFLYLTNFDSSPSSFFAVWGPIMEGCTGCLVLNVDRDQPATFHLRPYHGSLIFTCYWIVQTLLNFSLCSEIDLPPFIVNTCWIFRYFFFFCCISNIPFFSLCYHHHTNTYASFYFWWLVIFSWLRTHGDTLSPTFVIYVVYVISFSFFLSIPSLFFPFRFFVFLIPLWFLPSLWDSFTALWFKNEC